MSWQVFFRKQTVHQLNKLPKHIVELVRALVHEIEKFGPLRNNWKNFSKLRGAENLYHCHIKQGRPTYVVCWKVEDKKIKIVEVYYVGTHEKAPY
jgi:mRNA-degrading endonuclease RelE of RelBE toxin-antitoxin system